MGFSACRGAVKKLPLNAEELRKRRPSNHETTTFLALTEVDHRQLVAEAYIVESNVISDVRSVLG